ncbi:DNA internalization-related competence protein ComEC/Rec2 [Desulfovibrio inopinatus]|uniref:DNA internalization-related competence protein ComEC/Rec2 n=1 Tax=Desulfovibrio inopinatus TaxID=102109 RepID=UPI000426E9D7|nr:DNA internalization-related competence protein ComEC/Rec2 [Desulfovibrio inopinatus]
MTRHATSSEVTPGLVAWQFFFLAWILGCYATADGWGACLGFLLLVGLNRLLSTRQCSLIIFSACFLLGITVGVLSLPAIPQSFPPWVESKHPVRVQGVVVRVERKPDQRFDVICRDVHRVDGSKDTLPEKLVLTMRYPEIVPFSGDVVTFTDRIERIRGLKNPGCFDYDLYRQRQGIFTRAYLKQGQGAVEIVRHSGSKDRFRQAIEHLLLGENHELVNQGNAVLLALFTGDRSALSHQVVDLFRRAALAHTLALSGMHVGMVALLGFALSYAIGYIRPQCFLFIPRAKLGVILAFPVVAIYIWLGGFSPSLLRAGLMFSCFGLLMLTNRRHVLLDGLFAAFAAIVFVDPQAVFDVRLQLSGLAVAGIVCFWPLGRRIRRKALLFLSDHGCHSAIQTFFNGIFSLLWVSLCAQIAVLPVTARTFGEISPHILLNLVWPPLLSCVVFPLTLVSLILVFVFHTATLPAILVNMAATICQFFIDGLFALDTTGLLDPVVVWRPTWPAIIGYALLLIALGATMGRRNAQYCRYIAIVGILLVLTPAFVVRLGANRDHVVVRLLDTGQSQSLVVEYGYDQRILIDAGGGFGSFDAGRFVVGPYLSNGREPHLDMAILSHPESDHFGGYPYLLRALRIDGFYCNGRSAPSQSGRHFLHDLRYSGIPIHTLHAGNDLSLGFGLHLEVLHPTSEFSGSANDESLVVRLTKNGVGLALFPGDIEKRGLELLRTSARDEKAAILVLPHHGSRTSIDEAWYRRVRPSICLASAGYWRHGVLPSPEVLSLMEALPCRTYVTATHGSVAVEFDENGTVVAVETTR